MAGRRLRLFALGVCLEQKEESPALTVKSTQGYSMSSQHKDSPFQKGKQSMKRRSILLLLPVMLALLALAMFNGQRLCSLTVKLPFVEIGAVMDYEP